MSATSIYRTVRRRLQRSGALGRTPFLRWHAGLLLPALLTAPVLADYTNRVAEAAGATPPGERERLSQAFAAAKARYTVAPTNAEAAWQLARSCFDLADLATNDVQRVAFAREGIAVSRQLVARSPRLAAGHYYLALNLGELARTETFRALKLVKEMEAEFKAALELDPDFDHAGPDRSLGLLYQDAPGWPVSIGSRRRSREHLLKAVARDPGFPENRLCLIEALLEAGNRRAARAELPATGETLRQSRSLLTGPQWAAAWRDWDARLATATAKLGDSTDPSGLRRDR